MSVHFWMGIAIGSVLPWAMLIVALARGKTGSRKSEEQAEALRSLMLERNALEARSAAALESIANDERRPYL